MTVAIIVHAGAWEMPDRLVEAHVRGCEEAVDLGYQMLGEGRSALDAVETVVRFFEDQPSFDAGRGAFLNRDGVIELDAGLMDGESLLSAAVAGAVGVRNPVTLARRLLDLRTDRLVVGAGARRLAEELGVETCDPVWHETEARRAYWEKHRHEDPHAIFVPHPRGTVGAVALDRNGNIAAATSTGGLPGKRPGRVGDSPLVGCGFFADNRVGGASATGDGEAIMAVALARLSVERARNGRDAREAAELAVEALRDDRIRGRAGVILLDASGRAAASFTTSRMARAWIDGEGARFVGVDPV